MAKSEFLTVLHLRLVYRNKTKSKSMLRGVHKIPEMFKGGGGRVKSQLLLR